MVDVTIKATATVILKRTVSMPRDEAERFVASSRKNIAGSVDRDDITEMHDLLLFDCFIVDSGSSSSLGENDG